MRRELTPLDARQLVILIEVSEPDGFRFLARLQRLRAVATDVLSRVRCNTPCST